MRLKSIFLAVLLLLSIMLTFTGCSEADRVSNNISLEADNFNVTRKLTVINNRTGTILFQMTGNFSIAYDSDGDLNIIGENPDSTYYKHFVHMTDETTYITEDLGHTTVNKYRYEINFNPKMIIPIQPVIID